MPAVNCDLMFQAMVRDGRVFRSYKAGAAKLALEKLGINPDHVVEVARPKADRVIVERRLDGS